jgi:2'-5' RNA ligase
MNEMPSQITGQRFFIAVLPPADIQAQVRILQEYMRDHYNSRAALQSPPHVTLQPPFARSDAEIPVLVETLPAFASQHPIIPLTLSGFAAFPPRVVYIHVERSPALAQLQAALASHLEERLGIVDANLKTRAFVPHMTIAFRDLSKSNFYAAWAEFQTRTIDLSFSATHLTLLIHDGQRWNIHTEFPLSSNN